MSNLYVSETFVNADKGAQFGTTEPYETRYSDRGDLYRAMQQEYGRCVGKVYVDGADGAARAIGWVFRSRQRYEDARGHYSERAGRRVFGPKDHYTREVWVSVHNAPPTRTVTPHYAEE